MTHLWPKLTSFWTEKGSKTNPYNFRKNEGMIMKLGQKSTIILGILTKFGEIITTLAHFMADFFMI